MTRTIGSNGERTLRSLREAGLKRLYKQGFAGTTLRELAKDVGVQAGSLYNYFENKQDFLFQLMDYVMDTLTDATDQRLAAAQSQHEALMIYVDCHVRYHCEKKREVLISTTELRSLTPQNYEKIIAKRDEYERRLKDILAKGNELDEWNIAEPHITSKLILGMMTSVGTWYRSDGKLDLDNLVRVYQEMVSNLVNGSIDLEKIEISRVN
ncbi:TetR family transcriptional regulator [Sneathiella sp. P13V-1]|uniref:TetR/AcrR family transcriptional regulator n=1 Tax=Sneathiella sp. P13V-1 TaxID=2697366 RepID=UPI00187B7F0D|nr:TetR/AcrR family transcriptional regulator [Sneathiella sp. P13V-1]MBE7637241.1 TetR family transcriptional regulator [Sneathiella sp. P13V-1]